MPQHPPAPTTGAYTYAVGPLIIQVDAASRLDALRRVRARVTALTGAGVRVGDLGWIRDEHVIAAPDGDAGPLTRVTVIDHTVVIEGGNPHDVDAGHGPVQVITDTGAVIDWITPQGHGRAPWRATIRRTGHAELLVEADPDHGGDSVTIGRRVRRVLITTPNTRTITDDRTR